MQTQWLSLSPSICLSLSLCRSCHGFMHMKFSQSRDGKFILGENSPPFDSIPEVIHYYTTNKLPIAEPNTCLCCSRCWYRRYETTHTHTRLSRTQTHSGFPQTATTCFIFNHISQALREFDLCLEWELDFSGVWSDSSLVWMKHSRLYWHCIDVLHACEEIFSTTTGL